MKLYLKFFSLMLAFSICIGMFCACESKESNADKLINHLNYVETYINTSYQTLKNSDFVIEEIDTNEEQIVFSRIFPVFSTDENLNNYFNKINTLTRTISSIKLSNKILTENRECIFNNISCLREIATMINDNEIELNEKQINLLNEALDSMKNYSELIANHGKIIENKIKEIKKAKGNIIVSVDTLNMKYNDLLNQIILQNTNANNLCAALNILVEEFHEEESIITSAPFKEDNSFKIIYLNNAPEKGRKHYVDENLFN